MLSWDNGNSFNLYCCKAKTQTHKGIVRELIYADDAALLCFICRPTSRSCDKFALTIYLKNSVTMLQSSNICFITIDDTTLKNVEKFTYLRSTITKNTTVDQELYATSQGLHHFCSSDKCIWKNHHFSIHTKVPADEACVLSILLYGAVP